MKFAVFTVVVLALAFNAQCLPIILYSANGLGIGSSAIPIQSPALADGTHLYRAPLVAQWPLSLNAEGTYSAETLGSEHVAPLPGHFTSATITNLELAPGTKKEDFPSSSVIVKSPEASLYAYPFPYALNSYPSPLLLTAPTTLPTDGTITYLAKDLRQL